MENTQECKRSTVEVLVEQIGKLVFESQLQPGDRITEKSITQHFDVSRNTVREAFEILIKQGLLTRKRNAGVAVRVFSPQDIQEITAVRSVLECAAVEFISHHGRPIESQVVQAGKKLLKVDKNKNWSSYVEADAAFHRAIVASAGNKRLLAAYDQLQYELRLYIYQLRDPQVAGDGNHEQILQALVAGEYARARHLIWEHTAGSDA